MDFNSWIEKTFAELTWREAGAALFVCLATVLALEILYWSPTLTAADTGPKQEQRYRYNYESLLLAHSDQRLMWSPEPSPNTFNIAWISGSSVNLRNKTRLFDDKTSYKLPLLLSQHIRSIDGKSVKIYDYSMSGGMSVANLTRAAHAVDVLEPDLIILALNPFWVMQDRRLLNFSFHSKGLLLPEIGTPSETWALTSFLSPLNVFTTALQTHAPSVELRHLGRKWLTERIGALAINMPARRRVKRKQTHAIVDWIKVYGSDHGIRAENRTRQYQVDALMMDTPDIEGMGARLLELTLDRLGMSRIPALVYMAPTNPELRTEDAAAIRMDAISAAVQAIVEQVPYDTLHFDPTSSDIVNSEYFRDFLHLKNEGPMLSFITEHIENILKVKVATTSIASRFRNVAE